MQKRGNILRKVKNDLEFKKVDLDRKKVQAKLCKAIIQDRAWIFAQNTLSEPKDSKSAPVREDEHP